MTSAVTIDKYIENNHFGLNGCYQLSLLGILLFSFTVHIGLGTIGAS